MKTKTIATLGLFLALGLILPYILSHSYGIPGTILLPMHLPLLIISFLYGPKIGLLFGIVLPITSFIFTSMPSVYFLPIMVVELSTYGVFCGLFYYKYKLNIYLSLLLGLIIGKINYALMLYLLINITKIPQFVNIPSITAAIYVGMPGIILQFFLVPLVVVLFKKFNYDK